MIVKVLWDWGVLKEHMLVPLLALADFVSSRATSCSQSEATSCSQSEIKTYLGTFLPSALLGGEEPGAFLTTSDLPVSADTLGNLRLEDIAKAPSCAQCPP